MKVQAVGGLLLLFGLSACSGPSLEDSALPEPVFNLEEYFNGPLTAYGVVRDRGGRQTRSFQMTLIGSWEDGIGTLQETILFNDGERSQRTWTIQRAEEGHWTATAGDVIGEARFAARGNTLRLDYVLRVPYKGKSLDLKVEDWLYLQPDGLVLNQSVLKKWGLRVGDILTLIRKDR